MNCIAVPFIVAEVLIILHQDQERCNPFFNVVAGIGCALVKYQLFSRDGLFAPEIIARSEKHTAQRYSWKWSKDFLLPLTRRCREPGGSFSRTSFYMNVMAILGLQEALFKMAFSDQTAYYPYLAQAQQSQAATVKRNVLGI